MNRTAIALSLAVGLAGCQEAPAGATDVVASAGMASGVLVDPASGARCDGHDVRLTSDDFSIVLDGDCGDVTVTGSDGSLNVTHARSLRVEGSRVVVINERVGTVSVSGREVTLNLTGADSVELGGSNNLLMGTSVESVRFIGDDNTANIDNRPAIEDRGRRNKVI